MILHCHGGGFFSESPDGHGSYLRTWAKELDVPILAVNYSLAPQNVFPEALDQCFYIYCLARKHPERFGWTGESIVLSGDSAGGNLVSNFDTTFSFNLNPFHVFRPPRVQLNASKQMFQGQMDSS